MVQTSNSSCQPCDLATQDATAFLACSVTGVVSGMRAYHCLLSSRAREDPSHQSRASEAGSVRELQGEGWTRKSASEQRAGGTS